MQIWRNFGGELFKELQTHAEKFMNEIADLCDQRHKEMCFDARGSDLRALQSWPMGAAGNQQGTVDGNNQHRISLPRRQDDIEVNRASDNRKLILRCLQSNH